jgi:peptidoglycan DL-endopeptidase CwlO
MSFSGLGPVIGRIQAIESRFAIPSTARLSIGGTGTSNGDFAAAYSAALDSSTLTSTASTTSPTNSNAATITTPAATIPSVTTTLTYATTPSSPASGAVNPATPSPYDDLYQQAGERHGVAPDLLSAVGWVESRYQPDAISSAGAIGVMQIMPFVATELGVDPTDPAQAIDGAARLLRSHYDRFGSWDLALAAYNAGAGAVRNAGNAIPSPGVGEYVRRVNERMAQR